MKRHILLLFLVFIGINAMAQDFSSDAIGEKTIDIRGSKVYLDGQMLDKYSAAACFSSLNGVDMSNDYLRYRAGYKTGVGLTVGGASLAVVGFGTALAGFVTAFEQSLEGEDYAAADAITSAGIISVVTGTISVLAGIPTICVYKKRLNRLEKKHNASLRIGTSPGGVSMAISF